MAPQPANSLPPGDAVNSPITGQTGVVGTTEVSEPTRTTVRRSTRRTRRAVHRARARARARAVAPAAPTGTTAQ